MKQLVMFEEEIAEAERANRARVERLMAGLPDVRELTREDELSMFGATWSVVVHDRGDEEYRCAVCLDYGTVSVRFGHGGSDFCDACWEREGRAEVIRWHHEVTLPALAGAFGPTPFASSIVAWR